MIATDSLITDLLARLGEANVLWRPYDLALYEYDARLDLVVAIHFKGKSPGVFVYDPATNSWADPIPFPADGPKFQFAANTFFDRELNAYFCHVAGDSSDNGVMWVYRYKK